MHALSSQLQQNKQILSAAQQNVSSLQSQLNTIQSSSNQAAGQLSTALASQANLNAALQAQTATFNLLTHLFSQYSDSQGITVNPSIVLTKVISAEELAHTDVLKKACESQYNEGFDLAVDKLTNLDFQDIDGKTILMHAIINGFYYGVGKLLEKGADVNLIDNQGANALIYSAMLPHIKYTKEIAEKTSDLNYKAPSFGGLSALHFLVPNGNKMIFASELNGELKDTNDSDTNVCLDETFVVTRNTTISQSQGSHSLIIGANVDITIGSISTPPTSYEKTLRIMKFLVNKGADINCQNAQGLTPFFIACDYNLTHLVPKLLEEYKAQIDFSLKDVHDNTYLHYAARVSGCKDVVRLMANDIDINTKNKGGGTAVLQAAMRNNIETMEFLINNGADINILDVQGKHIWHYASGCGALDTMAFLKSKISGIDFRTNNPVKATALHAAAEVGRINIIKWLLGENADINAQTEQYGLTPLFLACNKKHSAVAEYLLNYPGFDKTVIDSSGNGILHWVIELRDKNIMQKALSKGVNVDLRDNLGNTVLFWAAKYVLPDIADLLFNTYNAQDLPNNQGYTAWDIAIMDSKQELIDVMIGKKQLDREVVKFWCGARSGNIAMVEQQLQKGIDINATIDNYRDTTALIQAVSFNHTSIVEAIVADGRTDVNKADKKGASPLYYSLGYAGQQLQPSIVKLLVSKGANVNQAMNDGDTPLHIASHEACVGAMKLLIDKGAVVDAANAQGQTPLQVLIQKPDLATEQKLTAIKYLLCKSASPSLKDNQDHDAIYLAQQSLPESLAWLEHPQDLPILSELEASLAGQLADFEL